MVIAVAAAGDRVPGINGFDPYEAEPGEPAPPVSDASACARQRLQPTEELLSAEEPIEIEGTVFTVLPGTMFRVKLDNGHEILAHLSGKMRKHFVRLTVGDRVRLEMSPYDLSKARITYRLR
jgi:translation initiation factor IF-1